ncbi:MAG: S-layer homology domain-containing protein [Clostridia bacterium]|nr:S-layer homology domain-containing protein [Clostridia bacterium]
MLVCYYDYEAKDTTEDKPAGTPWFEKYYEKAIGIGIIDRSKYADGYNYEVTRKEAALLMYSTLINNVEKMDFTKPDDRNTIPFTDIKGLDAKYYRAIQNLYYAGIIDGYENGTFKPEGILSRYEATKLIEVFMSKSVKLINPKSNVTNDVYQVTYKYEDDGIPGEG